MQRLVVDDRHLGVHVDRLALCGVGMIDSQAPVPVEPVQRPVEAGARRVHGDRLQPAMRLEGIDQDDLRPARLVKPLCDRLGDAA